jgi:hypothetical protein
VVRRYRLAARLSSNSVGARNAILLPHRGVGDRG